MCGGMLRAAGVRGEPIPEVQVEADPTMLSGFWLRNGATEARQMTDGSHEAADQAVDPGSASGLVERVTYHLSLIHI